MNGKRALFVHIPKTGGTSLYRMLVAHFGDALVFNPRVRRGGPDITETAHPVVMGHFHYTPTLREHFDFVGTTLRHPVARLVSLYRHARVDTALELHAAAQQPFRDFIRGDAPQLANWQTRQLAAWGAKHVNAVAYAQAHANLQSMDLVRVFGSAWPASAEPDAFLRVDAIQSMHREIVTTLGEAPRSDATPHERPAPGDEVLVGAEDRRFIESRNAFDLALCRAVS